MRVQHFSRICGILLSLLLCLPVMGQIVEVSRAPFTGGVLTSALQVPAGSAATPSLVPSNDTDTGFWFGSSSIGFAIGGANQYSMLTGQFTPNGDNGRDLGSQALRWRSVYSGGGWVAGITSKSASYTATHSDHTILVDTTSGAVTITLPAAASHTGRIYFIRKINASANACTIDPNAAELVNGAATYAVADATTVQIQCDGSSWHILSVS